MTLPIGETRYYSYNAFKGSKDVDQAEIDCIINEAGYI